VKQKIVGANSASQKQDKKLFLLQKMQHTNAEDSTNAQFAVTQAGCKAKGLQLKVSTSCDQKKIYKKNRLHYVITLCNFI
jgi:hypothetical protein